MRDYPAEWRRTRKPCLWSKDKKTVEQFPAFPGDNQDMPLDMIKPEHNRKFMGRKLERVKSGAVGQDGNFKIVEGW